MKEVKDFTNKELKEEWEGINSHIRNFACGRWELNYREEIEQEADRRGILL